MAQGVADGSRRRAALMGVRAVGMAQPVGRDLLLQPRRRGGRGEDLADALVGDRNDPLVGVLPVRQELQRFPRPAADPNGPSAVLTVKGDVATRALEVRDQLSAPQLHELFDAGAGAIERFDDGAIAGLAVAR